MKLGHLLTEEDKAFIVKKETEMRAVLSKEVANQSETSSVQQVLSSTDRLCHAVVIIVEENLLLLSLLNVFLTRCCL